MKTGLIKTARRLQAVPLFLGPTRCAGKAIFLALSYLMSLSFLPVLATTLVGWRANLLLVAKAGSPSSAARESSRNPICRGGSPEAKFAPPPKMGWVPMTFTASKETGNGIDQPVDPSMLNNRPIPMEAIPAGLFLRAGPYRLASCLTDTKGTNCRDTSGVKVDRQAPSVSIQASDNSTFFFDKPTYFRYAVEVKTNEGEEFDRDALRVTMRYFPKIASDVSLLGYPEFQDHSTGRNLIAANDCRTCHQLMGRSSVPTFLQISERYWGDEKALGVLSKKIITGGNGAWGEQVMSAHPQLSKEDAAEIVKYVLSVSVERPEMEIPKQGMEVLTEHTGTGTEARYLFRASYTNKSTGTSASGSDVVVLRPSKVEAEKADTIVNMRKGVSVLDHISNKAYFLLKSIDLKDIRRLTYYYASKDNGVTIEVHTDLPDGPVVSIALLRATGRGDRYAKAGAAVTGPGGKHDLYFVFVKNDAPAVNLASLDWVKFEGGNEVKRFEKKELAKIRRVKSGAGKKVRTALDKGKPHKQKSSTRKKLGLGFN